MAGLLLVYCGTRIVPQTYIIDVCGSYEEIVIVNQLVVQQNGVWVRDEDMEWYDSATSGNQNQAGAYHDSWTAQRARFGMSFPSRLIEARDTISHVVHGRHGQEAQKRYQF